MIAITHVRGGGELGAIWHEDGKHLRKGNSFQDFLQCCQYLFDKKYTNSKLLAAYGSSAGGLLIGKTWTQSNLFVLLKVS